jgi:hypothetical protein
MRDMFNTNIPWTDPETGENKNVPVQIFYAGKKLLPKSQNG